jgi:ABC-type sugar transport system ATPase subunit
VNVDITDGEFVILVGPSGCGKSTLLRMIAGLEQISVGDILIGERIVNNVPPKERDIAMVFQNYALYPHMKVYDNMAFSMKLRNAPQSEISPRVREAAEILGLTPLLHRRIRIERRHCLERLVSVGCRCHGMSLQAEEDLQHLTGVLVVVRDHDAQP